LLAKQNRKLPNKQPRLQSKLPRSQQHRSRSELNPNHAKNLHLQSPRLSKCERRERLPPSGSTILVHHKRRNLANQIPRLLQRRVQLSQKLQDLQRGKLALNKQAHRVGQIHKLQSRTRPASCGQRLWNPGDRSQAVHLCQNGKLPHRNGRADQRLSRQRRRGNVTLGHPQKSWGVAGLRRAQD
jgi:hypothetical protein